MVAKLKAAVKKTTGNTTHSIGSLKDGKPVVEEAIPTPAWVEIHEDGGGFFFMHFDESGDVIADTWHQSVNEAKEQAEFEFGILASDWKTCAENITCESESSSDH